MGGRAKMLLLTFINIVNIVWNEKLRRIIPLEALKYTGGRAKMLLLTFINIAWKDKFVPRDWEE